MHFGRPIAVWVAFALCSSPAWSQTGVQPQFQLEARGHNIKRTSESESESESVAVPDSASADPALPPSTAEAPVVDSLAYHSAIESSNHAGYAPDFSCSTVAAMSKSIASSEGRFGVASANTFHVGPFNHIAINIRASTLGAGIEAAIPLSRSFNLRAAANYADFNYSFNIDGINYTTGVNFRSGQVGLDWFPFHGGFHVSPGFLYFRNSLDGQADVPPGERFSLEDTDYINSVDDPVSGTASVVFKHNVAPVLTLGWGNIIPRSGRHFSVPFEIGAAYTGAGLMDIKLSGTACTKDGCFNTTTDPDTQSNLQKELKLLNNELRKFQFYPIVSLGFAYRF